MLSRIPQPQFVGVDPATTVAQAGDLAQKQSQMVMTALQNTAQNYIAMKNSKIEQEKVDAQNKQNATMEGYRQDTLAQAKQLLLQQDTDKLLAGVDPKEQWRVILENKQLFTKFYTGLAQGDKELGSQFYNTHLKTALSFASPLSFNAAGVFGQVPQASQAVQNVSAPAGAVPASATPQATTSTQAAVPATSVAPAQAPVSTAAPATAAAQPPADPSQAFWNYMQQIHANDNAMGQWKGQPYDATKAKTLIANNGTAYQNFLNTQNKVPNSAPAAAANASASSTTTTLTQEVTKGYPAGAAKDAAISGFDKVTAVAMGNLDPSTTVTPKEQAAMKAVVKPQLQILQNSPIIKDLLASGDIEMGAIEKARDELNTALQDPNFAQWFQSSSLLTDKEQASLNTSTMDQAKIDQITAGIEHNLNMENNAYLRSATTAMYDKARIQLLYQSLVLKSTQEGDKQAGLAVQSLNTAQRAIVVYTGAVDAAVKAQYGTTQPTAKQIRDVESQLLGDPASAASQAMAVAVPAYAKALQIDASEIPSITVDWADKYAMGLELPLFKLSSGGSAPATVLPAQPPASSGGTGAGAAAPKAGQAGAGAASTHKYTDAQIASAALSGIALPK